MVMQRLGKYDFNLFADTDTDKNEFILFARMQFVESQVPCNSL